MADKKQGWSPTTFLIVSVVFGVVVGVIMAGLSALVDLPQGVTTPLAGALSALVVALGLARSRK